jgi:hypothetical protein
MDLAMWAVGNLALQLGELLKDEYALRKGLKPAVVSLTRELVMMEAALADVSRMPSDQLKEVDKRWARQVRELSYDMEDAADAFTVRVAAGREPTAVAVAADAFNKFAGKVATMMNKLKERHQIAVRINDIKNLSKELSELHARYTFSGNPPDKNPRIDPRVLNLYKDEADLVGIDKARDELIRMLALGGGNESPDLSLKSVSIVGSGGLGKTAIAKTVHDRLKKEIFQCWAFVSVGRNPSITMIFEKMLRQLDDDRYSNVNMSRWDADLFINELHKFLHDKRWLFSHTFAVNLYEQYLLGFRSLVLRKTEDMIPIGIVKPTCFVLSKYTETSMI